jgi:hypothetical protein
VSQAWIHPGSDTKYFMTMRRIKGIPGYKHPSPSRFIVWLALGLAFSLGSARALTTSAYVTEQRLDDGFCLVADGRAAGICVTTNDWPGVRRAAADLQTDFRRVSGVAPLLLPEVSHAGSRVIIIGTIGQSALIDQLARAGKIDISAIAGKWEASFAEVVAQPWPGVDQALVICGSDRRGTIYGVYDLSEQMGVSPWHFFADVPATHHDTLFVQAGKHVAPSPVVKYRGIFLNDEAPDLSGWTQEKFGGFNHGFYTNVFELLLRLKANYLWPAMWDNCFNEDDPENFRLADEYGIVMGTSHVEPMMRADKEWNRRGFKPADWNFQTHSNELMKFWRDGLERNKSCENLITIAMRGKRDTPMSATANVALLEEIVAAQRKIIAQVYQTNAATVPQLWALYKEVQEYYEKGMRVPDDVTLLWSDDNWGNLRRLPSPADRQRPGGSGIYYHLDYVGMPRNYKWVNTVALARVWEQMQLAHAAGADRIWMVNVGHLQHVPLPTEFFLTLAWNPDDWPKAGGAEFMQRWAAREFGAAFVPEIVDVVDRFTRLNAHRKPELLSPDTFSVVNYQEADRVLAEWQSLAGEARDLSQQLPSNTRDAFFELVLYPVQACANLNELYVAAAKNRLYAAQGRAGANLYAAAVKRCFDADAGLTERYHRLAGGKWEHMMDQTHIGYANWQQPKVNVMPRVTKLTLPAAAKLGVAIEGSTNVWPDCAGEAVLPEFDKFNQPTWSIEVFNRGRTAGGFATAVSASWILLRQITNGVDGERIGVSVSWPVVPAGETNGFVLITSGTNSVRVRVNVSNPPQPSREAVEGFVAADGYVSIEANHFTDYLDAPSARWEPIGGLGNSASAMRLVPPTAASVTPPQNSPCLEYKIHWFKAGPVQVETRLAPTLNYVAGQGLRFGLSWDDDPVQIITAVPEHYTAGDANEDWQGVVADNVRKVRTSFNLKTSGPHTLKFWMVDAGVILEKIIVDGGGVRPSYFGPPESFHR